MSNEAVIGLGSNIDPQINLKRAIYKLGNHLSILKQSGWIYTSPVGIIDQPDFINGTILIKTEMERETLKDVLRDIEDRLGRDRSLPKSGPRVIDLDIIIWNGKIVDEDYYEREFLRGSVAEILPEFEPV